MDKITFKSSFFRFLEEEVANLSSDKKIKYMKKWIKEYEQKQSKVNQSYNPVKTINTDISKKVGILVRTSLKEIISAGMLSSEKIKLLQDEKYCKYTFDINYPFLKKVVWNSPLINQRDINGYPRYWKDPISIHNESYLICNDWYERNKQKYINWVSDLTR
ncbi:hypothetical protein [Niallia oryzisoli]|uniref:hypothetical protein n=1 Tax=Niallia oryzisoli TaxID=1737571 RepID=UPI003735E592